MLSIKESMKVEVKSDLLARKDQVRVATLALRSVAEKVRQQTSRRPRVTLQPYSSVRAPSLSRVQGPIESKSPKKCISARQDLPVNNSNLLFQIRIVLDHS